MACSLHYVTPASGGWGVVKTVMLVPESYFLFVCPFACGRHGSIAITEAGLKDRLSYIFVDQTDIIDGYEDLIVRSVPEYLEAIAPARPKVLFIFVSCLDDLIGTNHEAVLKRLRAEIPDVEFEFGHMNPITMDSKSPPPITAQRTMYSLLRKSGSEPDKAVNLIGNLDDISPDSELIPFLAASGYETRHISRYSRYEDFLRMGSSALNLVIDSKGVYAAKEMEKRLGIPYLFLPVDYSLKGIEDAYARVSSALGLTHFDMSAYKNAAEKAIKETLDLLGDYPLTVDNSGFMRPYSLAAALVSYGFNVEIVFSQKPSGADKAGYEELMRLKPDMKILDPRHIKGIKDRGYLADCVAVGSAAAYLTGSVHPANVTWDAGKYGYMGLVILMEQIQSAYKEKADLRAIIKSQRLVI